MKISYNDIGTGPVLVLLHGFCESKWIWKSFESVMNDHFRVISVDLPGFGESEKINGEISIDELADILQDFLSSLKIQQCTMIGHSLGGYITLSFAERHSAMLNGFGLFHSTAFDDSQEKKDNRNKTLSFIEKHGVDLFAKSFVAPLFNPTKRNDLKAEIDQLINIASNTSKKTIIEVTKAMRDRPDKIQVLKKTMLPVMFIIGKADTAIPLEASLKQCYLPNDTTIHLYEKTGHMGMFERRIETIECIKNFANYCNRIKCQ